MTIRKNIVVWDQFVFYKGLKMKPIFLEDKLINFLTGIVWWFEVRWNKGAIFVAFLLSFLLPVGIFVLLGLGEVSSYKNTSFEQLVFAIVLSPLIVGVSTLYVPLALLLWARLLKVNVLKNTKISPNPNKVTVWIWMCRLIFMVMIVTPILPTKTKINEEDFLMMCLVLVLVFWPMAFSNYVLCVDPIPLADKAIRRKKSSQQKISLLPVFAN